MGKFFFAGQVSLLEGQPRDEHKKGKAINYRICSCDLLLAHPTVLGASAVRRSSDLSCNMSSSGAETEAHTMVMTAASRAMRETMRELLATHSRDFSWESSVQQLVEILR